MHTAASLMLTISTCVGLIACASQSPKLQEGESTKEVMETPHTSARPLDPFEGVKRLARDLEKYVEDEQAKIRARDKAELDRRLEKELKKIEEEHKERMERLEEEYKESLERQKKPGVRIGMTSRQVMYKSSWGEPKKINTTTTATGTTEQWVYESGSYLYFRNGKLYAIQN